MRNGASHEPPVPPQPSEQPPVTADDIQRQQRGYLALRSLDLEVENVLLQQEVQRLKARIAELEITTAGKKPTIELHPDP